MPLDVHEFAIEYPQRVLRVVRSWNMNWTPRTLAIAAAAVWASVDFVQWRRVEGGFPLNPLVWALSHISQYTLAARWATARFARKLVTHTDATRKLEDLPQRVGPKPTMIRWAFPHRHIPQMLSREYSERTTALLRATAAQHGLLLAPSVREHHRGISIYAQPAGEQPKFAADLMHTHPGDGSVHVSLHPRDAAEVIAQGWGTPFPFANIWLFDPGLVLIWAPRNEDEMLIVEKIVKAGVEFLLTKVKK